MAYKSWSTKGMLHVCTDASGAKGLAVFMARNGSRRGAPGDFG